MVQEVPDLPGASRQKQMQICFRVMFSIHISQNSHVYDDLTIQNYKLSTHCAVNRALSKQERADTDFPYHACP